MIDAFLCSARPDRKYLALTVRLLEFHRIAVWPDSAALRAAEAHPDHLVHGAGRDRAASSAARLLVVVTRMTVGSSSLARQVAAHRSPDVPVLVLLFDDVDAAGLPVPGEPRTIRFFEDLDAGYADLVRSFGRAYLPLTERRTTTDRRAADRRRADQRGTPTVARLRIGLWRNYATATGYGEYDDFGHPDGAEPGSGRFSAVNRLATVLAAANGELRRYRFLDRAHGTEVRLGFDAVRALADAACRELETLDRLHSIYVVEYIAELLVRTYDVRQRDRRTGERRASADRRMVVDRTDATA